MEFVDEEDQVDDEVIAEIVIHDTPYSDTAETIKTAVVESVVEAAEMVAEERKAEALTRIIPPWERKPIILKQKEEDKMGGLSVQEPVVLPQEPKEKVAPLAALTTPEVEIETSVVSVAAKAEVESTAIETPVGPRWAVARKNVDISGKWFLVESEGFKKQYDEYLTCLGQPAIVRTVALSLIGLTREETIQENEGRTLIINGINPRGIWNRKLVSSGTEPGKPTYEPIRTQIYTADSEKVEAEAWWEENGTVHKSWLRGGRKYGGGDFESSRYLENENVLICKSAFHPGDPNREKAQVAWRFQREGT